MQSINTNGNIDDQINIANVTGDVRLIPKTRWQKRFERLQQEVKNDDRYATFIEDFNTYNTIQDGIGLEKKLEDAGFSQREMLRALGFKEKYSKRVVKGEMFLSQQEIDVEIFSIIDNNFETYVFQKILENCDKKLIIECLFEKVVNPIMDILNKEGEADNFLNYSANDIYGMIYFLTGKCHLNWKNYDII